MAGKYQIKIGHRVLVFWFLTILLSLIIVGMVFFSEVIKQGEKSAQSSIGTALGTLAADLNGRREALLRTAKSLAARSDVVASSSLIDAYQNPQAYRGIIFDEEKKKLARVMYNVAEGSGLDLVRSYTADGVPNSFFARNDLGYSALGYLSFDASKPIGYETSEIAAGFSISPGLGDALLSESAKGMTETPGVMIRHLNSNLLLFVRVPVFRVVGGQQKIVGYMELGRELGYGYIKEIKQLTALEFSILHSDDNIEGNHEVEAYGPTFVDVPLLDDFSDHDAAGWWHIGDDIYIGAVQVNLVDHEGVVFVLSQKKAQLGAEIEAFGSAALIGLFIIVILVGPFGIYYFNKTLSGPIQDLMVGVGALKTGRYEKIIGDAKTDEFGQLAASFNALIDTLEEREKELLKFSYAVHQSDISVVITNTDGDIEYVNPCVERITGFSENEIIGGNPRLWKSGLTPQRTYEELWAAIETGVTWRGELLNKRKNGELFWELAVISPIKSVDGEILNYIALKEDITQRKESEREIHRLNQNLERRVDQRTRELEAANAEMEAFTYSVSHDLRTPLRTVDGFSRILMDSYADTMDEEVLRYLERIRHGVQRMGTLINDLLSFSRSTRGNLRCSDINVSDIVNTVAGKLLESDPERDIKLSVEPDVMGHGDPRLVQVVLDNLLGNAWKYTSTTENPEIGFSCETTDGEAVYRINDNGAGFDMAYAEKLFLPFQRLHRQDEFEGSGIGLATVQRIISHHGGQIWANSTVGEGASFYFTLGKGGGENDEAVPED